MSARRLLLLSVIAFVALGMPKAAFGVAWPSVAGDLGRPLAQLGTVVTVYVGGYLATTLVAGSSVRLLGTGRLLAASSALGAVALAGYAVAGSWPLLLASAFGLGASGGWIDSTVNTHVALHHGARAMGVLHAGFGVGSTLGPLVMTILLGVDGSWRIGFWALAAVQGALTVAFVGARSEWGDPPRAERPRRPALERRSVLAGALVVFALTTGMELATGQWAFTLLTEGRGVSATPAGLAVAGFWGGLTLSRIALGVGGDRLAPATVLRWASLATAAGAALLWWSPVPWMGPVALAATGVALGPIFPLQTLLTPRRVGAGFTPWAVGYQIAAANVGAAIVPGGIGLLVAGAGLEAIGPALAVTGLALAAATRGLERMAPSTSGRPAAVDGDLV